MFVTEEPSVYEGKGFIKNVSFSILALLRPCSRRLLFVSECFAFAALFLFLFCSYGVGAF